MAITITDRALQEFTDSWQDPINKYIRLYSRKLVFEDQLQWYTCGNVLCWDLTQHNVVKKRYIIDLM